MKQWIQENAFGEGQRCPQISKGSRFWAHRWVTMITFVGCWRRFRRSNRFCWKPSPKSQTCSQRGFFCARQLSAQSCLTRVGRVVRRVSGSRSLAVSLWDSGGSCGHVQSFSHIASIIGELWFEERGTYEGGGLLGQLGRCSAHNSALTVQHLEGEPGHQAWKPQVGQRHIWRGGKFCSASVVRSDKWIAPEEREPEDHEPGSSRAGT